ncbi:sulfotransferase domain-containing protein [Haloarcula sp. GH36]|uniref:sulfotransferase domain-containing protein n=1 Tax=Haloarcula montana TaxID=3111776 RepID=UPI002D779AAD|nr:sulfotransferase domain-containing protein [Haloarcula sp. GH36]
MLGRAAEIYRQQGTIPLAWKAGKFAIRETQKKALYTYIRLVDGPSDFIKSGFPKSGNNWVHFLIANAMVAAAGRDDEIHFRNKNDWVATGIPDEPPVEGFPRMVSNSNPYDEQPWLSPETRTVYIVRHPADVMESFYHYRKYRWNNDDGSFDEFIRDAEVGLPAWRNHVESWENNWDVLIRFEDLKDDPAAQLGRICSLWERDISSEVIEAAVEASSFENMQRVEQKYGSPEKDGANPDYTFMRKGETNYGDEYFTDEEYEYLIERVGDVLTRLDYLPTQP